MHHFVAVAALVLVPALTVRTSATVRQHLSDWREMYYFALFVILMFFACGAVGNAISQRF